MAGSCWRFPDADFGRIYGLVDTATARLIAKGGLPHYPSFFELLTAIAFAWFAEQRVELAVLEVGLGGRLDATNSVEPIVSVITDIGIDHTEYLGNTIREIAGEKAGILRQDGVLVTLAQHPEANAAIGEAAVRLNVRGVDAARCLPPSQGLSGAGSSMRDRGSPLARNVYELSYRGRECCMWTRRWRGSISSGMLRWRLQRRSSCGRIITLVRRAGDSRSPMLRSSRGFARRSGRGGWSGLPRAAGQAPLLLDVAHNPAGAWTLRAALSQLPEELPRTLIFGCLADKQIDEMEQVLLPLFDSTSGDPARARDHVILAPVHNPRAATVEELAAAAQRLDVPVHLASDLRDALQQAQALTPADGVIVATGSVFLVGEIRALALTQAG